MTADEAGPARTRRPEFEAAVEEAERHFLDAREAWHAQRGDITPARERMTGLPSHAPQSLKEALRRHELARDAWLSERDRGLAERDHGPGS